MSFRRISSWLLGIAFTMVGSAFGQQTPQIMDNNYAYGNAPYSNAASNPRPILPGPTGFVQDARPFAPADISEYGNGPKAHDGWFFSYDRMLWTISRPSTAKIGSAAAEGIYVENNTNVLERNSLDTSMLSNQMAWGNRWELGYVDKNDYGWYVGVYDHIVAEDSMLTHGTTILFDDPNNYLFGFQDADGDLVADTAQPTNLIPRFENVITEQRTALNGVELMKSYRLGRLHNGGVLDVYLGARYFQVDDSFMVKTYNFRIGTNSVAISPSTAVLPPGFLPLFDTTFSVLDDSIINARVKNDIVGPQMAVRWSRQRGRVIYSFEGRFMPGANFQHGTSQADLATKYFFPGGTGIGPYVFNVNDVNGVPTTVTVTGITLIPSFQGANNLSPLHQTRTSNKVTFVPMGEFRFNAAYDLTRSVAVRVGYTAMVAGGISRASNRLQYALPNTTLIDGNNRQNLFVNGLSFGIEYNR